jgi:hypothetical protein
MGRPAWKIELDSEPNNADSDAATGMKPWTSPSQATLM